MCGISNPITNVDPESTHGQFITLVVAIAALSISAVVIGLVGAMEACGNAVAWLEGSVAWFEALLVVCVCGSSNGQRGVESYPSARGDKMSSSSQPAAGSLHQRCFNEQHGAQSIKLSAIEEGEVAGENREGGSGTNASGNHWDENTTITDNGSRLLVAEHPYSNDGAAVLLDQMASASSNPWLPPAEVPHDGTDEVKEGGHGNWASGPFGVGTYDIEEGDRGNWASGPFRMGTDDIEEGGRDDWALVPFKYASHGRSEEQLCNQQREEEDAEAPVPSVGTTL